MKKKLINSQLNNLKTYDMYFRQMLTLAENVFEFKNLSNYIDSAYMNKVLVRNGQIAFFKDEYVGLLALEFSNIGQLDVYGRPTKIQVFGRNGSYHRTLEQNEFVIMYDNNGRYPIYLDIAQYAERMALDTRTEDLNIAQQKNPRLWTCSNGQEKTLKDILNNIDCFEGNIITYKNITVDPVQGTLLPVPYVANQIEEHKDKIWNEFLRLIGVANMNFQKKERNIKDEVLASQGGTIASRFSRFEPRKKAIEEINEKFGENIEVSYYDGIPAMNEQNLTDDIDSELESESDTDV